MRLRYTPKALAELDEILTYMALQSSQGCASGAGAHPDDCKTVITISKQRLIDDDSFNAQTGRDALPVFDFLSAD